MGKKGKKKRSHDEENKENRDLHRRIQRLEKELHRKKKRRRKRSSSCTPSTRTSRTRRSSSRGSSISRNSSRSSSRESWASSRRSRSRRSLGRSQGRRRSTTRSRSRRSRTRDRSVESRSRHSAAEELHDGNQIAGDLPVIATAIDTSNEFSASQAEDSVRNGENTQSKPIEETPVPEHEIELQDEVLKMFGPRLESDAIAAPAIHKDISLRWAEIVRNGLPPEEVKSLVEKYPAPDNCRFMMVPKVNAVVIAASQESAIKRDLRIVEKQERITACLAAVEKAIAVTLKIDDERKMELLEHLSDGGRLLASLHREESVARKGIIQANFNASLKSTLSNTVVDEWLFGADLDEKLKVAKDPERTSKELKPQSKPLQQRNNQRSVKNPKGPPRQSSFKRQTSTSGGRRLNSSSNPDAKKPYDRKESSLPYRKRR